MWIEMSLLSESLDVCSERWMWFKFQVSELAEVLISKHKRLSLKHRSSHFCDHDSVCFLLRISEIHAEEQRNIHSQPANSRAEGEFMLSHQTNKTSRLNLPCGLQDSGDCATARDTACQFVQADVKRFLTCHMAHFSVLQRKHFVSAQLIASDVAFEVAYYTPFPRSELHNVSPHNVILL